jgi:hypothetical protein
MEHPTQAQLPSDPVQPDGGALGVARRTSNIVNVQKHLNALLLALLHGAEVLPRSTVCCSAVVPVSVNEPAESTTAC